MAQSVDTMKSYQMNLNNVNLTLNLYSILPFYINLDLQSHFKSMILEGGLNSIKNSIQRVRPKTICAPNFMML